jgi:hypothetical protein
VDPFRWKAGRLARAAERHGLVVDADGCWIPLVAGWYWRIDTGHWRPQARTVDPPRRPTAPARRAPGAGAETVMPHAQPRP